MITRPCTLALLLMLMLLLESLLSLNIVNDWLNKQLAQQRKLKEYGGPWIPQSEGEWGHPLHLITCCWLNFVHLISYFHLGDINNVGHPNLVQRALFSIFMDYGVNISYFAHLCGPLFPKAPSLGTYSLTFMGFGHL